MIPYEGDGSNAKRDDSARTDRSAQQQNAASVDTVPSAPASGGDAGADAGASDAGTPAGASLPVVTGDELSAERMAEAAADTDQTAARTEALDVDNARRFVQEEGHRIAYDHTFNTWCFFDGTAWRKDELGRVVELVKQTAERTYAEARASGDREFIRQARAFMQYNGFRNALLCASTMDGIAVSAKDWDTNPYLFNVTNGTIDLQTCILNKHNPADRITMVAGCAYEPDRKAEFYDVLLKTYFPPDNAHNVEIVSFLTNTLGYCLSGLNTEKMFLLLVGSGNTGKTTFMRGLEVVWGDYFRTADWSSFTESRDRDGSKHRTDLARLVGARVVSASEGEEGCKMSDGVIKRITGGSKLTIRDMHSKPFEFRPTYKMFFDTNHPPRFKGQDRAMWQRVRRVPFRNEITVEAQRAFVERYGDIDKRLAEDAVGILSMAVGGWRTYYSDRGILVPEAIIEETKEYQKGEDVLGQFLADRCKPDAKARTPRPEMFRQYSDWAKENNEFCLPARRFNALMAERTDVRLLKTDGVWMWEGMQVILTMEQRAQGGTPLFTSPD